MGLTRALISLCIVAIWICSATVNAGNAIRSTKITDLNDDCLYETFMLLELDDLRNLVDTSSSLAPIASRLFTKKTLESIANVRYKLPHFIRSDNWGEVSRELNWMLTPSNSHSDYQKVLLLLKKLAEPGGEFENNYLLRASVFEEAINSFAERSLNTTNHIEQFVSILSIVDHYEILNYLGRIWQNDLATVLSYVYMLILEKSDKHLNKQFTYSMFLQMNRIRNAANAYYLLKTIGDDKKFQYIERFQVDWNLYKGGELSDDAKGKFHLAVARVEMPSIYGFDFRASRQMLGRKQSFARIYCAMRSLSALNSTQLIDASNLQFAIFDLADLTSRHGYYELMTKFKIPFFTSPAEILTQKIDNIRESARNVLYDKIGPDASSLVEFDSSSPFLNLPIYRQTKIDREIIAKLHKSLEVVCKGSRVIETGFQQLESSLNEITGKYAVADIVNALTSKEKLETNYDKKLMYKINSKVEKLEEANDFTDYIKLLKVVVSIGYRVSDWNTYYIAISSTIKDTLRQLIFAFIGFVDRPHIFDNTTQLIEVDRLHNRLTEQFSRDFLHQIRTIIHVQPVCRELLKLSFENFDSIFPPKPNESVEVRTKQRIILKLSISTASLTSPEQIPKIIELFYSLAYFGGEFMADDSALLREWNALHNRINIGTRRIYLLKDIEAIKFMYEPYEPTDNPLRNAIVFFAHLKFANHLCEFGEPIPDQMLDNIVALEESVGEAEITEEFLRTEILNQKLIFYRYNSDRVREKQANRDLKKFVDSKLDLLLCQSEELRQEAVLISILKSIFVAVRNNSESAKELLGDESIERLGLLSQDFEYVRFRDEHLYLNSDLEFGRFYKECKGVLGFKEKIPNYLP